MGYADAPLSYDELSEGFEVSLGLALLGADPTPVSEMPEVTLMLALLEVTDAVRENRPTQELIARARKEFAEFAADYDTYWWSNDVKDSTW